MDEKRMVVCDFFGSDPHIQNENCENPRPAPSSPKDNPSEVVNLDAVPDPTMPEEAADRAVGYCRHVKADGPHHYACSNCIAYWMRRLVEWPEAAMKVLGEMLREPTPASPQGDAAPIPMMLHCPKCHAQHIDAPEPEKGWENPPHKSHLCHACGTVWRPADVPTSGVVAIATRGSKDTWIAAAAQGDAAGEREVQTAEEAKAELRADGIDPDAAAARMIAKVRGGVAIDKLGKAMIAFDLLDACLSDKSMSTGGRVVASWKVVQEALKICAMPPALAAAPLPAQPTPAREERCDLGRRLGVACGAPAAYRDPRAGRFYCARHGDPTTMGDEPLAPATPAQTTEEVRRDAESLLREAREYCEFMFSPEWLADPANRGIFAARIYAILARAALKEGSQ